MAKKTMTRRKKGTGSLIKRGSRWYGRLREGSEERLTEGCATAEEAETLLDRMLGGEIDPRFLPSLEAYWERLLEPKGVFEDRYEDNTCNLYDTVLATTVRGTSLGKMRLDQIHTRHVQRHVERLYKTLTVPTVKRYGSCIAVVLQQAADDKLIRARIEQGELIPANPARGVKYRLEPDSDSYIHSEQELADFPALLYKYNRRLSAMYTVLADTGVRPGELCAMDTADIKAGVWKIHRMRRHDGSLKNATKNGRIRFLKLSEDALAAISEEGQRKGPVWLNEDGHPVRPDALYTHLCRFRKALQLQWNAEAEANGIEPNLVPPLRPKDLRKTFVTRALESPGVSVKAVQTAVGHRKASTTTDVYAKARKGPQGELIDALQASVNRSVFGVKGRDKGRNEETDSLDKPA